jgi:hypothetical protein
MRLCPIGIVPGEAPSVQGQTIKCTHFIEVYFKYVKRLASKTIKVAKFEISLLPSED